MARALPGRSMHKPQMPPVADGLDEPQACSPRAQRLAAARGWANMHVRSPITCDQSPERLSKTDKMDERGHELEEQVIPLLAAPGADLVKLAAKKLDGSAAPHAGV